MANELPDVQHSEKPPFPIYIHQVGVQCVKVPFKLDSRYGGSHELVADVTMTTDLEADKKGISMSMLLRTLSNHLDKPLKSKLIKQILEEFQTAVETDSKETQLKFEFELPIHKRAPKSGLVFPQYYQCGFEGRLTPKAFTFFEKVKIQYGSYCPCSASLCGHLKEQGSNGFPHAQRAIAEVIVKVIDTSLNLSSPIVWLEDIIDVVENSVKTGVYPLLRRVDEQEVARIAAENPMFVEDSIRRIANGLNGMESLYDWIVKCTHQESIHMSDAIAVMWKGVQGGLNGSKFL
jgi:GTP cyclohydrolase I